MATVSVTPDEFTMVEFSSDEITSIATRVLEQLDLSVVGDVTIEVDETSPLARAKVRSTDPVVLAVEGGAFEDTKRPRQLSEDRTADTIGRYLLKVADRVGEKFANAPGDDELTLAESVAWDVYCVGRLARNGFRGQRKRRLYQFRNRHGFTDAADEAFEELWTASDLSWNDISQISRAAAET